jgi:hypothetical protein
VIVVAANLTAALSFDGESLSSADLERYIDTGTLEATGEYVAKYRPEVMEAWAKDKAYG